jgi:hypothetical protein
MALLPAQCDHSMIDLVLRRSPQPSMHRAASCSYDSDVMVAGGSFLPTITNIVEPLFDSLAALGQAEKFEEGRYAA